MTRHETDRLWLLAENELEREAARDVEAHLDGCSECREGLASIYVAKEALDAAREAAPKMSWAKTDQRISAFVEEKIRTKATRSWSFRIGVAGLVAATAAAVTFFVVSPRSTTVEGPSLAAELPQPPLPPSTDTRVDEAFGLEREGSLVVAGTSLQRGDVIRTQPAGRAFVHLPDLSHMRVASGTEVALDETAADDVAMTLGRGRVAVRASHVKRKGFVVRSQGVSVHVIGTIFAVTSEREAVDVDVSEGKVRVDMGNGRTIFVAAGEHVRMDTKTKRVTRTKLSNSLSEELDDVAAAAQATTNEETATTIAAVGGPSAPPMVAANPRLLPRLDPREAQARQVVSPQVEAPAPVSHVPAELPEEPGSRSAVGISPEELATLHPRGAAVDADVAQWAELPEPEVSSNAKLSDVDAEPTGAPMPPPSAKRAAAPSNLPTDLESIFFQRVERALEKGDCSNYMLGLEDIAMDSPRSSRTELARIYRARCFDQQLRPRQAMNEYRKYLDEYPRGQHSHEARTAVGH